MALSIWPCNFEESLSDTYKERQHRVEVNDCRPGPRLAEGKPWSRLRCVLN